MFTITTVAVGGAFPTPVTFSVSGLPTGATATFNPPSVAPGSSTVMTVTTTTQTFTSGVYPHAAPDGPNSPHPFGPWPGSFALGTALAALLGGMSLAADGRKQRIRLGPIVALFLLAVAAGVMTGCVGGFPRAAISHGTPPGTYHIVVTGTTGTDAHTATVTLIVE